MNPERKEIDDTTRLEVVEERLRIGKHEEERIVHVHQRLVERTEHVSLPLESYEVELETVPMDRFVDAVPAVRIEGDVTIIPVVEEVITVRLKLVEEIRVRRVRHTHIHEEDVILRRTQVSIDEETDREPTS